MLLYELATVEKLSIINYYVIRSVRADGYYCGQFGHTFRQVDGSRVICFFNARFVWDNSENLFSKRYPYFYTDDSKFFKRVVFEEEQRATYRRAFEKRAVEQIISSILGHPFKY